MSKDVHFCLDVAESLYDLLLEERFEPEWATFQQHEQQAVLHGILQQLVEQNLASVEKLVVSAHPKRIALIRQKPSREAFLLALAAIRYCLEAAAILQGQNLWLAQRPLGSSLIVNAHRAHNTLYQDKRSVWPFHSGRFGAKWD